MRFAALIMIGMILRLSHSEGKLSVIDRIGYRIYKLFISISQYPQLYKEVKTRTPEQVSLYTGQLKAFVFLKGFLNIIMA